MKFTQYLTYFRERAHITKTDLAQKINVSPTYIMHIEDGKRPPPTIDRCREIAQAISLSPAETDQLIDAAMEERLSPEALQWLAEKERLSPTGKLPLRSAKLDKIINDNPGILDALKDPEILEALADPVIIKAVKSIYQNKAGAKEALYRLLERFSRMDPEKRKAILALCS